MGKIPILTSSFQVGFQPATGLPVGEYFVTCSNIIQNECQETREAVILGLSAVADQTCSGTCCSRVEDRAMNEDLNFLSRTGIFHCHVWFKFTAGYNLDQIIPSTYAPLVPHCSILVIRGTPYTCKKPRRVPKVDFYSRPFPRTFMFGIISWISTVCLPVVQACWFAVTTLSVAVRHMRIRQGRPKWRRQITKRQEENERLLYTVMGNCRNLSATALKLLS